MAHALLPDPDALSIDSIAIEGAAILFKVRTTAQMATCPDCGCRSDRTHSRYQRAGL